eukprot:1159394-Pelagomonas_calceolata.AAC.5
MTLLLGIRKKLEVFTSQKAACMCEDTLSHFKMFSSEHSMLLILKNILSIMQGRYRENRQIPPAPRSTSLGSPPPGAAPSMPVAPEHQKGRLASARLDVWFGLLSPLNRCLL